MQYSFRLLQLALSWLHMADTLDLANIKQVRVNLQRSTGAGTNNLHVRGLAVELSVLLPARRSSQTKIWTLSLSQISPRLDGSSRSIRVPLANY